MIEEWSWDQVPTLIPINSPRRQAEIEAGIGSNGWPGYRDLTQLRIDMTLKRGWFDHRNGRGAAKL